MKKIEPGVYDINIEDYHASAGISRSGISKLKQSPLHYWEAYLNPNKLEKKSTRSLDFGSLLHEVLLDKKIISLEGLSATKEKLYREVIRAADSVTNDTIAAKFLTGGLIEKSIYWVDEDTNVLCKVRPDIWFDNVVVDLKTTTCAKKEKYKYSVFSYDYHIQAAMIFDGIKAIKGVTPENFIHIVVENKPPYLVMVYVLKPDTIKQGQYEYKNYLKRYAECLTNNEWPGYECEDCYL